MVEEVRPSVPKSTDSYDKNVASLKPCHGEELVLPMPSCRAAGTPAAATPAAAAELAAPSIYDVWSHRRRGLILAVVSMSQFLNPLSSSIVLPSLKTLEAAFHADSMVGAAILAVYYFPLGISSLFWGPACDMWGRKTVYLASTALYAAATVGCIFPRNIQMLLGFRALQGTALGAYRGAGIGTIADIFPPDRRGVAIGILVISTLVGPVIGPVLGGFLADAYGWQAPFIALLVFSAGIIIPITLVCVRETHQYKTMQRLTTADPAKAAAIREGPQILAYPPKFGSPLAPLIAVFDRQVVLHLLVGIMGFAALISAQTELPNLLTKPPYSMTPSMIGVAYLACGIAGCVASPMGGKLFDNAAAGSAQPMFRITVNNVLSMVFMPFGLLLFGWSAQRRAHLALVLSGMFFIGGSMCVYLPAFMGFLSVVKQKQAGTAAAGQNALVFVACGVLTIAGSAIGNSIGIGWYMTSLAVLHLVFAVAAHAQIMARKAAVKQLMQELPNSNTKAS